MLPINLDTQMLNQNYAKLQNLDAQNLSKDKKKLKEVCDDFESFFLQQILNTSLKSTNIAGESTGSEIIKGLYTEGISQTSNGSFGLSNLLFQHLSQKLDKAK